jgi:hypothetical protein
MINRTYIVKTPSTRATFVDICVRATMGTRLAPVADPATYVHATPAPSGWAAACGDAAYYEIRGRTLRLEHLFAEGAVGGFTPRVALGFNLSVVPYGVTAGVTSAVSGVQLSQSLLAAVGGDVDTAIAAANLADPAYGPVIRLSIPLVGYGNPQVAALYVVSFSVAERKDDDYDNLGSP